MYKLATEPQSMIHVIIDGYRLWKQDFKQLILLSVIAVVVGTFPHFFIPHITNNDIMSFLYIIQKYWYYALCYLVVALFFLSAIIYRVHLAMYNIPGGISDAFLIALKRLPFTITALILAVFAIGFGNIFLIIPGLILTICLAPYQPLIVIYNKGPLEAFRDSCRLVWGNWWRTLVVLALSFGFFFIFIFLIEIATWDLWRIELASGGHIPMSYNLVRIILNAFYYPLFISVLLVLMHDLELRRAYSLEPSLQNHTKETSNRINI